MVIDEEFERLKKRKLAVLTEGGADPGHFRLEGSGLAPSERAIDVDSVRLSILEALRTVYDPEIPLNIYDLGLIYGFDLDELGDVHLKMTLTAPGCPVAGSLVKEVHDKLLSVPGVRRGVTELVWDPPWSRERMSEAARFELGLL